jgi:hypothetical protein
MKLSRDNVRVFPEHFVSGNCQLQRSLGTENIRDSFEDPFEDPFDAKLVTNVPGWSGRVEERKKPILRLLDGVAAANLKSWL